MVTMGQFISSQGMLYNPKRIKGANNDLRFDPFQMGGEKAEVVEVPFTKLEIEWADIPGFPSIQFEGSSDMLKKPNDSLPFFLFTLSPKSDENRSILLEALKHAKW